MVEQANEATTGRCPHEIRDDLPRPIPPRMLKRPIDHKGYVVPYFVAKVPETGIYDFRIVDPPKFAKCIKHRVCWLCGEPLGKRFAFVVGPMCTLNLVSSEPPSHVDCATWAAKACPFLTKPRAKRRTANLPEQIVNPAGECILRNPGCVAVWITDRYRVQRVADREGGKAGYLIQIGAPIAVEWFAEGRAARRDEVEESIATGLPYLYAADGYDPLAMQMIDDAHKAIEKLLPTAAA